MDIKVRVRLKEMQTGKIHALFYSIPKYINSRLWSEERYEIISCDLFTGLKDRNDKDIYAGDVVSILYTDWPSKSADDLRTIDEYLESISHTAVVEYVGAEFKVKHTNGYYGWIYPGEHGRITVIGNIYETPEMLSI